MGCLLSPDGISVPVTVLDTEKGLNKYILIQWRAILCWGEVGRGTGVIKGLLGDRCVY